MDMFDEIGADEKDKVLYYSSGSGGRSVSSSSNFAKNNLKRSV